MPPLSVKRKREKLLEDSQLQVKSPKLSENSSPSSTICLEEDNTDSSYNLSSFAEHRNDKPKKKKKIVWKVLLQNSSTPKVTRSKKLQDDAPREEHLAKRRKIVYKDSGQSTSMGFDSISSNNTSTPKTKPVKRKVEKSVFSSPGAARYDGDHKKMAKGTSNRLKQQGHRSSTIEFEADVPITQESTNNKSVSKNVKGKSNKNNPKRATSGLQNKKLAAAITKDIATRGCHSKNKIKDKNIIIAACNLLQLGERINVIAQELGVSNSTVKRWGQKFLAGEGKSTSSRHEGTSTTEGDNSTSSKSNAAVDVKLTSQAFVVLTKDPVIDELSMLDATPEDAVQKYSKNPFWLQYKRRMMPQLYVGYRSMHVPKRIKLEVVKMIKNGTSIDELSRALGVNKLTLKSWLLNRRLLKKKFKGKSKSKKIIANQVTIKKEPVEDVVVKQEPGQKQNVLEEVDRLLFSWYLQEKMCGVEVTQESIFRKGNQMITALNMTTLMTLDQEWFNQWRIKIAKMQHLFQKTYLAGPLVY